MDLAHRRSPVADLPPHLARLAVPQEWERYTAIDHAVWRYVMRQAVRILTPRAHASYLEGLRKTGINLEAIPRIEEMNAILSRIGWGAVTVDGFIPPAAFMEFQAHRVLVIAADMRQIDHVEYTPAPDIVHEAAGHAPIIADPEYAEYLRRFGEVGARAISSRRDLDLYEAIRALSVLKEEPGASPGEVRRAEERVAECQANLGEPSEMALLSRLHWWTVEYGLIGTLEDPKLYGAGLLSSIGEAVSCLEPGVARLPYSLDAARYPYDITTRQPQLFVTPDFGHAAGVLEQFARGMAFRVGGLQALARAVRAESPCTAQLSSGLQISGVFAEAIPDPGGEVAYLRTRGPSALAFQGSELAGHGRSRHPEGFGTPLGRWKNLGGPPEEASDAELATLGISPGGRGELTFASGATVSGEVVRTLRRSGRLLAITWRDCRVLLGGRALFDPAWGEFDMAVGESVPSVFGGPADRSRFEEPAVVRPRRLRKIDASTAALARLYQQVRDHREGRGRADLGGIWDELRSAHSGDWLLPLELLELARKGEAPAALADTVEAALRSRASSDPPVRKLIGDGLDALAG